MSFLGSALGRALALAPITLPSGLQAAPPSPILYFTGIESYTAGGKRWERHRYDVANKDQFSDAMFARAPELPPCGLNTKSSRTWVDIYDSTGKRLYGFCALTNASDLKSLWFATEEGTTPPCTVYIVITDRQTNTKFKSNLAATM
jgi:hypothetical protein